MEICQKPKTRFLKPSASGETWMRTVVWQWMIWQAWRASRSLQAI